MLTCDGAGAASYVRALDSAVDAQLGDASGPSARVGVKKSASGSAEQTARHLDFTCARRKQMRVTVDRK